MKPGDKVRVTDDNGGDWPGTVLAALGEIAVVYYAGDIEQFTSGRRGNRYFEGASDE